jgi:thiamine-phosphate pyrophosphorylase|tara:strand:- start:609 stop:1232 length:624 start_codon:yes stop_codon:yes gene_type:complete
MNMPKSQGIYVISDCKNRASNDLLETTEEILSAGISLFQFRDKNSKYELKKILAKRLQVLCRKYKTPFIINDDVELAKEISADGVHLGKNNMNINKARNILGKKIIGVSCYNNLENAICAEKLGANYIAFGSFFNSPTKPDAKKAEIKLLVKSKSKLKIPIVAIGGITPENGGQLVKSKVDFLAVISGIYQSENIRDSINSYKKLFR